MVQLFQLQYISTYSFEYDKRLFPACVYPRDIVILSTGPVFSSSSLDKGYDPLPLPLHAGLN